MNYFVPEIDMRCMNVINFRSKINRHERAVKWININIAAGVIDHIKTSDKP